MLTDYDRLPEFVPNLAVTERVPLPEGSPSNLVRLRQARVLVRWLLFVCRCIDGTRVLETTLDTLSHLQM